MQLRNFWRIALLGIRSATPMLLRENLQFLFELHHTAEYDKYFTDKKAVLELMEGPDKFAQKLTAQQQEQCRAAIDSAILVFAHSILDAAALDYISIAALVAPEDAVRFVSDRRVPLAEIEKHSYEDLRTKHIEAWLEQIERESLLKKMDVTHQLCQPPADFDEIEDYKYDRDRLMRLDRLRHDVVHGEADQKDFKFSEDDLHFMHRTWAYLFALVHTRYNLRVDTGDRDALAAGFGIKGSDK